MNYLVAYDVRSNKKRRRLSEYLIDKGLIRIQMSVFIGEIDSKKIVKFKENIKEFINIETDSLYCIPISKEEYEKIFTIGKNVDYKLYEKDIFYI